MHTAPEVVRRESDNLVCLGLDALIAFLLLDAPPFRLFFVRNDDHKAQVGQNGAALDYGLGRESVKAPYASGIVGGDALLRIATGLM